MPDQPTDPLPPDPPTGPTLGADTNARPTQTLASASGDTAKLRPDEAADLPRAFGRYELRRLLGKGGMAEVYLAHDTLLHRTVALKIPRFGPDQPVERERFLREARTSAGLAHAGLCPVHDVGEADGRPYLTMAYVDGPSLAAHIAQSGPMEPHAATRLVRTVALAMHYAHAQGVLHRDLKPSNILLRTIATDEHGLTQIEKQDNTSPNSPICVHLGSSVANVFPVVTDFGLAFRLSADVGERLTEQGLVLGTPAYMPPEQIDNRALTPAADVYSLGVVLYELLTGRVPFQAPLGQLLTQIMTAPPPPPRRLRADLDPALEALCLKALAKRPADRHADMAAFARALDDYLAGRARPPRRWAWAAALAAGLVAIALVAATAWHLSRGDDPPAVANPPAVQGAPQPTPEERQREELNLLFKYVAKPIIKVEYPLTSDAPARVGRGAVPASLLGKHDGPLYFMLSGSGSGHVVDLTDQPGQGMQLSTFVAGDVTIRGPYLTFVGGLAGTTRVAVHGGPGISMLAPMNSGAGSGHIEFDGTHLLLPKLAAPKIDSADATPQERAKLASPHLTRKLTLSYEVTRYVIYARPDVQVVRSDKNDRRDRFPEVDTLIELDRRRQMEAKTITQSALRQALEESKKQLTPQGGVYIPAGKAP